jgi:hypothetical protein
MSDISVMSIMSVIALMTVMPVLVLFGKKEKELAKL